MVPSTHKPPSSDDLDSFDFAILEILQRDNSIPLRTLGEAVNLSAAAVQRRIKRMRETGVIVGNIAVVDPARLGSLPVHPTMRLWIDDALDRRLGHATLGAVTSEDLLG